MQNLDLFTLIYLFIFISILYFIYNRYIKNAICYYYNTEKLSLTNTQNENHATHGSNDILY